MKGFHFTKFDPDNQNKSRFEQLLDIFMQILTYTSGDVGEAMSWMNELDKQYKMTDGEYGIGDFYDEMKDKGYITEDNQKGEIKITPKTEQGIRKKSLEDIFGKLKKTKQGDHHSYKPGIQAFPLWGYAGTD
jgi:Ca-activated chloride channel family protein